MGLAFRDDILDTAIAELIGFLDSLPGTTGFGARQRRAPTGGAAKGIPLNATIDGSLPGTPET